MGLPPVTDVILYNGASGSLGRYLEPALARRQLRGYAIGARLEDRAGCRQELASLEPDTDPVLLQLAARVSVPACEADPKGALKTNVTDTVDTVRDFVRWAEGLSLRPRVLYVSSGHIYDEHPAGVRIAEDAPTRPRSVYARSKLLAERELGSLAATRGFGLVIARVFGLIAPRQPEQYVLPGLIRRAREGRLGEVPGLSYVRDYLDARDVCDDLLALCGLDWPEHWHGEVVNVCSGRGITVLEVLQEVVRALRPAEQSELLARVTEAPGRRDDIPWIVGDPSRFMALTGEHPLKIPLAVTVRDACATA